MAAELVKVHGRRLSWQVTGHDGVDEIGSGTHERAVIALDRFNAKVQDKLTQRCDREGLPVTALALRAHRRTLSGTTRRYGYGVSLPPLGRGWPAATARVRAIRFNLYRGGPQDLKQLVELGHRVAAIAGWHVECYLDARDLPELSDRLSTLPRLSVDHLGLFAQGTPALLKLVERGARVKATGFPAVI